MDSSSFAERLQLLTIQLPPFVMAVCFHEYAHGFIAQRWGDNTAKDAGRLTLNPIPHLDPIGTVLFPVINMLTGMNLLIGWARPVPIDPRQFKKFRPGLFCVALAGPGMNFLLAIVSAAAFCMLHLWMSPNVYLFDPLVKMCIASLQLNFALGIFNLVPLPPLDGSKILEAFLPYELARKYEKLGRYSFLIILGLLWLGAFTYLMYPISFCSGLTLYFMTQVFHVPGVF